ncbi:signal peptidase I [Pontibacter anaerobius]|uniref:Signal peptidase I n=1 Tax=Pontibacter anaerobius TaxID=2993940 RepID=A0ABT3RJD5_9BACT|nr:signal peptidase I [Pontibacter anaerobius]MCX2741616.1 signal peptidase I [Pontibacter anaerobius]
MKVKFWESKPETKEPKKKKSFFREWGDAILFAVIAASLIRWATFEAYTIPTPSMEKSLLVGDFLFVSKLHYGPRTPMTPLQVPLTHQTIWGTNIPSYSDAIQLTSYRLPGFSEVKRNDVVVFNFPPEEQHPADLRTNYIKRCIGLPGDSLEVRDMQVFINGEAIENPEKLQYKYVIVPTMQLSDKFFQDRNINLNDLQMFDNGYVIDATPEVADEISKLDFIKEVILYKDQPDNAEAAVFPHMPSQYKWNKDFYGPIYIPKEGATVAITPATLPLYERVILEYEHNENAEVRDGKLYLDGQEAKQYTFKQDYYFMMGDNRHNSLDSRYWGYVPADHIVGKAVMIWMSTNPEGNMFSKIRWDRIFNIID